MSMTQCSELTDPAHFFIPIQDCVLETILHPTVRICLPVIKVPRSARSRYSESELAAAAIMLGKLRSREEKRPPVHHDPANDVIDAVVEQLLDRVT